MLSSHTRTAQHTDTHTNTNYAEQAEHAEQLRNQRPNFSTRHFFNNAAKGTIFACVAKATEQKGGRESEEGREEGEGGRGTRVIMQCAAIC